MLRARAQQLHASGYPHLADGDVDDAGAGTRRVVRRHHSQRRRRHGRAVGRARREEHERGLEGRELQRETDGGYSEGAELDLPAAHALEGAPVALCPCGVVLAVQHRGQSETPESAHVLRGTRARPKREPRADARSAVTRTLLCAHKAHTRPPSHAHRDTRTRVCPPHAPIPGACTSRGPASRQAGLGCSTAHDNDTTARHSHAAIAGTRTRRTATTAAATAAVVTAAAATAAAVTAAAVTAAAAATAAASTTHANTPHLSPS